MIEFGLDKAYYGAPSTTELFVRTPEHQRARMALVSFYGDPTLTGRALDAMVNADLFTQFMFDVDTAITERRESLRAEAIRLAISNVSEAEIAAAALDDTITALRAWDEQLPRPNLDHLSDNDAVLDTAMHASTTGSTALIGELQKAQPAKEMRDRA